MEKYKKKSLNFMGFSRELRKNQRDNQRCISRNARFSIIRPLEDKSISEEKNEDHSRIPTIGKPDTRANSRVELLQKWKQEKIVKKQQESQLKKPVFKVGINKPNPPPSDGNKLLFALDTSKLYKSSFQVSNSVLFGKKQNNLNASKTKTSAKFSNFHSFAKKTEVDAINIKTSTKDMKIQQSKSVPKKPDSKWTKNKESGIQSFSMKPKVDVVSRIENKDKLPTAISKPLDTKKIPSSGLPKPTISRTRNKVPDQQIPEKKNTVKSIPKFSRIEVPQQRGNISEKAKKLESNVPNKTDNDLKLTSFECELSHIEPVKEPRKSFAPEGFMFQPPVELSNSLFLENGPSAIFMKIKHRFLRTSTPKQSPATKSCKEDIKCSTKEDIQCSAKEDIQCSAKEDIQCSAKEDIQCSKITNKEFSSLNKYDFENILSSSLESVALNDCKQSLKFEFPEVGLTQNQEEVLLPSKVIHPENLLPTEPPSGDVKSPILVDSVETDKTEKNFTDVVFASNDKVSVIFSEGESGGCEDNEIPDSAYIDPDEMAIKIPGGVNSCLQKQENGPLKIPEIKSQKFRQSQKPGLASINESLENTPKSALKNFLDNEFTPRRSLRLAKLSGNFSSLEDLLVSSKQKEDKTGLKESFTPRRSSRLSKFSTEFNSAENLFHVTRPTLYSTPEEDVFVPKPSSRVTYDFDRLSSEVEEETCFGTTRSGKISLLYTPPNKSRPSIMRQSIKGDLLSFSPNV